MKLMSKSPGWAREMTEKSIIRKLFSQFIKVLKKISAQHSSNNGKNWQKLSCQKILLAW